MRRLALLAVFAGSVFGSAAARADHEPVLVIPSRAGVPIMIHGRDASYAVVEGDWGLARSIHVQPVVTYGWDVFHKPPVGHYFPHTGHTPGYGRLEISRPRRQQTPAASFSRDWSSQSAPGVVTTYPPFDPPPVILAPRSGHGPQPHPHP